MGREESYMNLFLSNPTTWEPEEWEYLNQELRLTDEIAEDHTYSVTSAELLDPQQCAAYLDRLQPLYRSSSRALTASMFSKRYAFMMVCPMLYAMSVYRKTFSLTIDNCQLESAYFQLPTRKTWMPNLFLRDPSVYALQSVDTENDEMYTQQREDIVRRIFADHLQPILKNISEVSSISRTILWENIAIYVYVLYENRILKEASEDQRQQIQHDLNYLTKQAPADCFGEKRNPLSQFYTPKRVVPLSEQPQRVRKTCCAHYELPAPSDYCPTCPKICKS